MQTRNTSIVQKLAMALLAAVAFNNQALAADIVLTPPAGGAVFVTGGGIKFPDGTIQATAATPAVAGLVYHRTYAGFEFRPGHTDLTYGTVGAAIYALALGSGGLSFRRALDLPNGAQIRRIDFYVIDNNAVSNMAMQLTQSTPSVSVSQTFPAQVSTSNAVTSPNVQTVSLTGNPIITIDTSLNSYSLRYPPAITGTGHQLVGAHIEFTLPSL